MKIIKEHDISKHPFFSKKRNKLIIKWIMQGAKLNQLNDLYKNQFALNPDEFIENIFHVLKITPKYFEKELDRIPDKGSFISYANHPLGILDGLLFIYLLRKKRVDIKILANDFLSRVEPFKDFLIPVDVFQDEVSSKNVKGVRKMYKHLNDEGGILIFPAGEVSTEVNGRIQDKIWNKAVTKLMLKPQVPLIPVFFDGENSPSFHFKGKIHPDLRTLALVKEMYNKKNSQLFVRIGKPVDRVYMDSLYNLAEKQLYLRAKIYGLGNPGLAKFPEKILGKIKIKPQKIISRIPEHKLRYEIESIKEKSMLMEIGDFELYLAKQVEIPNIVDEIGRLREITFRKIGEGTGKSSDLDIFDSYYHHLFIWNKKHHCVVGSYRIGFGKEILGEFGKSGFYSHRLFKYKNELLPVLERSIELGRSFVRPEFQKHPVTLSLLWRGILEILINNTSYRYLLGPVSISNDFSEISKEIMIQYLRKQFFDFEKAKHVKPRKPYKLKFKDISEPLLKEHDNSLKNVDDLIGELEPFGFKIPVLLKKYLGQNAKLIGFNIDPNFNNCLDGLILLDFAEIPSKTIKRFSGSNLYEIRQRQNAYYFENVVKY